jgi:hypothetical protein
LTELRRKGKKMKGNKQTEEPFSKWPATLKAECQSKWPLNEGSQRAAERCLEAGAQTLLASLDNPVGG